VINNYSNPGSQDPGFFVSHLNAFLAQMVERFICTEDVIGSIPVESSEENVL
jgi:hypothetical protein